MLCTSKKKKRKEELCSCSTVLNNKHRFIGREFHPPRQLPKVIKLFLLLFFFFFLAVDIIPVLLEGSCYDEFTRHWETDLHCVPRTFTLLYVLMPLCTRFWPVVSMEMSYLHLGGQHGASVVKTKSSRPSRRTPRCSEA